MSNFPVNRQQPITPLCELALKYKTDKVPEVFHSYTPYYHELLKDRRERVKRVLEIGIGYPETMKWGNAEGYVTGASLYMWRDYFPNAEIYALDNRCDILVNENHIHSFLCDQSNENLLIALSEDFKRTGLDKFDLIIDDGSHRPEDQALTARILAPLLADDGLYIIEDVLNAEATIRALPLPYEVKDFGSTTIHDDRVVVMHKDAVQRPVTIVVLSRYRDVLEGFTESIGRQGMNLQQSVVLVQDGDEIGMSRDAGEINGWTVIQGPEKFSMAGNGNLGLKAVPEDNDILYCGDDIRFTDLNTIAKLQSVAYVHPEVGILSPRLEGRSSPALAYPQSECDYVHPLGMWFPCVYIKRELINKIGYLDERFSDFGCDDLDYNIRTELAGYKLAVTNAVSVQHEFDRESGGPTTFVKNLGKDKWEAQQQKSLETLRCLSSRPELSRPLLLY